MRVQRLGTYIEQYSQKNKNDEPYPVYSVTNSEGFCTEYFNKDVSGKNKTNYKIVPKGYFAYNPSRINVGSIDWQNSEDNVIVSPIYVVFKCLNGLNQDYLKYFIKSSEGIRMINSKVSGAVRNNLRFEDLSEFEFNIVDYDKQLEVVNTLRLIEKAIKNEKHQLELLDEFIKARFVEMFGHQSHNEKGLPYMTIDDVAEIYLGITHTPEYVEEGVTFISAKNTSGDFLDLTDVKYISREEFSSAPNGSKPKKNDVLFSRVGSNLGHPVILEDDIELCTFVSLGFLRTKGKVTSNYLKHWMRDDYFPLQVAEHVKGGGQPNLNTGWLKQFKIIVPDLDAQYKFDAFCKQVDKSKVVVQERLEKYEELLEKKLYEYYIV